MVLLKLFLSFFKIGLFAIGGAYSFLPLIEAEVVERYGWLTKHEFLDMLGLAKVIPGAISVKFATYTGYKIAGLPGAIVTNLGNLLGPVILMVLVLKLYFRYKDAPLVRDAFSMIQLAVFAMIIAVAFKLVSIDALMHFRGVVLICAFFALFIYTGIHPALILLIAGVMGLFLKI